MNIFLKVTILGILLGLGGCLFGCVTGDQERIREQQEIEKQAEAREAAEINVRLSECRKYLEQGEVDKARAILKGVLQVRPDHPEALSLWERVNTNLYSTVYPGNTLSGIAAYYYDDGEKWSVIAHANGIGSPDKLKRYARLRVPWLPACEEGKDEAGRLGRSLFGSSRPTKIVLHPVAGRRQPGGTGQAVLWRQEAQLLPGRLQPARGPTVFGERLSVEDPRLPSAQEGYEQEGPGNARARQPGARKGGIRNGLSTFRFHTQGLCLSKGSTKLHGEVQGRGGFSLRQAGR